MAKKGQNFYFDSVFCFEKEKLNTKYNQVKYK